MYDAALVHAVTGVKQDTFRTWRTRAGSDGKGLAPALDYNGYNGYSRADVFRIGLMNYLLVEGFALDEAVVAIRTLRKELFEIAANVPRARDFGPVLVADYRTDGSASVQLYFDKAAIVDAVRVKYLSGMQRRRRIEMLDIGDLLRDIETKLLAQAGE